MRFLGTGGPFPSNGRLQSAILVESGARRSLVDCGMTALVSLDRHDIDPRSVDAILISHLHGDHYGGLPLVIFDAVANAERGGRARARPLVVAGPADTEDRVRQVLDLFGWRTPLRAMTEAGLLRFVTLEPRTETAVGDLAVTAFPAVHTPEALALRVRVGGRTVGYSGDTDWTDDLIEVAADADLFICVVYSLEPAVPGLLSYRTLKEHRDELTCRRLVLTHAGRDLVDGMRELAEEVATEGLVISLGPAEEGR